MPIEASASTQLLNTDSPVNDKPTEGIDIINEVTDSTMQKEGEKLGSYADGISNTTEDKTTGKSAGNTASI